MMYVPTVMLYFVGVSVFVLGPRHQALADNKTFTDRNVLCVAGGACGAEYRGIGRGKVDQQSRRHRNNDCSDHAGSTGHRRVAAFWDHGNRGRFQDSG